VPNYWPVLRSRRPPISNLAYYSSLDYYYYRYALGLESSNEYG
jgi:hypothetical protein